MSQQITAEQLAEIREKCLASTSVVVRQVLGGYIVQGKVNWSHDGNLVAVQEDECVVTNTDCATRYAQAYLERQAFQFQVSDQPDLPFETTDAMADSIIGQDFREHVRGSFKEEDYNSPLQHKGSPNLDPNPFETYRKGVEEEAAKQRATGKTYRSESGE